MSQRTPGHTIHPLFASRWSPRAFSGVPIGRDQLHALFEAARWAPSAYNAQPWRFIYALKGSEHWEAFLDLLLPFNQRWAANAAALVFVVSKSTFVAPGKDAPAPLPSHAFDTGAAWASLALQAAHDGLATHAMGGFDRERARALLQLPADYALQAAVAIGHQGARDSLPEDLRAREQPSQREPLQRLVAEARFAPDLL
ncbi:nitroreductase family protein [Phytopseudomonas dryadis]|nr:nitroreductase family protein [Pseudomonas dryadis]